MANESKLKYLPISFFSIIMGLTGFFLSLEKAAAILHLEHNILNYLLYLIVLIFLIIAFFYLLKMIKYFPEVRKEIAHPVRLSFFPTFSISLILLGTAFLEINTDIAKYLFIIGTALQFIATIYILSQWVRQTKFEIGHINPSWFIPIVGNILVPIAGVHFFAPELSWFFYSIGIVFWLILLTIFMYRIIFHQPLPEKLLPTFFILIAPPAIGFISYVKLTGGLDSFAKILYNFALFVLILLITQFTMFKQKQFYLSAWAYSFPLAAITIATALMYQSTGLPVYWIIFLILLGILTLCIVALLFLTIRAMAQGKICQPED
jgi:tellurite resistance protein